MLGLGTALVLSYLIGSFPTAYLLVKWLKRVDVRTVGSGNVGATNVSRVAGFKAGLAVFLIDAGKGLIVVRLVAPWLLNPMTSSEQLFCGFMAVLGHNFPIGLNFKGGKGVATALGTILRLIPWATLPAALVWIVILLTFRYVSLASVAAAAGLPLGLFLLRAPGPVLLSGLLIAALIIFRHQENLGRLSQGTEPKLGQSAASP